jgi:hypothetical protein
MKNITPIEFSILLSVVFCIFFSEYIYLFEKDYLKAIFIGLWPPTILGLLNFINSKKK